MDSQQLLWARVIVAVGQLVGDKRLFRYLRGSKDICRPHWNLISAPIVLLSKGLQGVKVQRFVLVQQLEHLGTGQLVPKDSTFMKSLCFPSISRKLYSHPWKTLPDVFCAKCDTWVEKAARVLRILMEGIKNKVLTKNNYLIPSLPQVVLAYSSTYFGICQRQHLPGGEDYWGFNPELGKREVHPTCQMKRLIIVRAARRRTPVLATCHHHNNYHHDYHVIMVNSPKKAAGTAALLGGAFSTTVSPAKTFAAGFYNLWTISTHVAK